MPATTSRISRAPRSLRWPSASPRRRSRDVYGRFGRDPADNAGRLMRFDVRGVKVLVDYAHNPDGLRGVLSVARALRGGTAAA